jgi:8-oxo-dGTP diphosphatase
MEREHRISAGAIVVRQDQILLVRYNASEGKSFLVGPGGGVLGDEGLYQAVIREVREETGLEINPYRVLLVEDLLSRRHRMVKLWLLCNLVGGELTHTQGALEEGIIEAGWYRKDQLQNEVVYPSEILYHDWNDFFRDGWEAKYLKLKTADF